LRILSKLVGETAPALETARLCDVSAEITGMTGAGIMLMSDETFQGSVCATNDVSSLVERLQEELGEGPCVDAYNEGRPIHEPDLSRPATPRWVGFSAPAIAAGVRAVFGFPLQIGAVRLGALHLYCDRPGVLTEDQVADALVMADVAAKAVLVMQAEAPPGALAAALQAGGGFQNVVHQATGMVAAQLDVSVGQALVRLRAHAFGHDEALVDVASAVVARTLRFGTI
jgi:hypothetical protein